MPRVASADSCSTCIKRKIRCDGARPLCCNCAKSKRDCNRPAQQLKFIIHTGHPASAPQPTTTDITPSEDSPPVPVQNNCSSLVACERAIRTASLSPREAMAIPAIADVFAHYIQSLAPWYDLNDAQRTFGTMVPLRALDSPVLFKAIMAFSAIHKHRLVGDMQQLATAYHAACVEEFLASMKKPREPEEQGDYLAATCLLHAYEILSCEGESRIEQRHLLGAYSFAMNNAMYPDPSQLLRAGAFSYLRQEITSALECRRPVRMCKDLKFCLHSVLTDDALSNRVAYLLAEIVNFAFDDTVEGRSRAAKVPVWASLSDELTKWKQSLPKGFEPVSKGVKEGSAFPYLWVLQPWHVAAHQYHAVAEMLLALYNPMLPAIPGIPYCQAEVDLTEDRALLVCGLAYTNNDVAARVNAFGCLAYCGRFLRQDNHRKALKDMLIDFSGPTAWPVQPIIQDLEDCWASK